MAAVDRSPAAGCPVRRNAVQPLSAGLPGAQHPSGAGGGPGRRPGIEASRLGTEQALTRWQSRTATCTSCAPFDTDQIHTGCEVLEFLACQRLEYSPTPGS